MDLNDLDPRALAMLVPIVAIIVGGILLIAKAIMRHRERIAMIERGMHPDAPEAAEREGTPSGR